MAEIVVVGNEEFTLGFELVGIKSVRMDKFEELISKASSAGIVIISQDDYDTLNLRLKNTVSKLVKPIIVICLKMILKAEI